MQNAEGVPSLSGVSTRRQRCRFSSCFPFRRRKRSQRLQESLDESQDVSVFAANTIRPDRIREPIESDDCATGWSLPQGWETAWDSNSERLYYFRRDTKQRTWQRPQGPSQELCRVFRLENVDGILNEDVEAHDSAVKLTTDSMTTTFAKSSTSTSCDAAEPQEMVKEGAHQHVRDPALLSGDYGQMMGKLTWCMEALPEAALLDKVSSISPRIVESNLDIDSTISSSVSTSKASIECLSSEFVAAKSGACAAQEAATPFESRQASPHALQYLQATTVVHETSICASNASDAPLDDNIDNIEGNMSTRRSTEPIKLSTSDKTLDCLPIAEVDVTSCLEAGHRAPVELCHEASDTTKALAKDAIPNLQSGPSSPLFACASEVARIIAKDNQRSSVALDVVASSNTEVGNCPVDVEHIRDQTSIGSFAMTNESEYPDTNYPRLEGSSILVACLVNGDTVKASRAPLPVLCTTKCHRKDENADIIDSLQHVQPNASIVHIGDALSASPPQEIACSSEQEDEHVGFPEKAETESERSFNDTAMIAEPDEEPGWHSPRFIEGDPKNKANASPCHTSTNCESQQRKESQTSCSEIDRKSISKEAIGKDIEAATCSMQECTDTNKGPDEVRTEASKGDQTINVDVVQTLQNLSEGCLARDAVHTTKETTHFTDISSTSLSVPSLAMPGGDSLDATMTAGNTCFALSRQECVLERSPLENCALDECSAARSSRNIESPRAGGVRMSKERHDASSSWSASECLLTPKHQLTGVTLPKLVCSSNGRSSPTNVQVASNERSSMRRDRRCDSSSSGRESPCASRGDISDNIASGRTSARRPWSRKRNTRSRCVDIEVEVHEPPSAHVLTHHAETLSSPKFGVDVVASLTADASMPVHSADGQCELAGTDHREIEASSSSKLCAVPSSMSNEIVTPVDAAAGSPPPRTKAAPPLKGGKGTGKGPKGKGPAVEPRKQDTIPSIPLKKLFWTRLNLPNHSTGMRPTHSNIWEKIDVDRETFDMHEVNYLFSEELSHSPRSCTRVEDAQTSSTTLRPVRILDEKRRRQIWFALALMPNINIVLKAVESMSDETLNPEKVELLLSTLPPSDEEVLLSSAPQLAAHERWDVAEEFVLGLIAIPNYRIRICAWNCLNSFDGIVTRLEGARLAIERACELLRNSQPIEKLLSLTLYVGNYLNGGTPRGRADGFDLGTLPKLSALKAGPLQGGSDSGTLLDFLVRQAEDCYPGSLRRMYSRDMEFEATREAKRFRIDDLMEEVNTQSAQIGEYVQGIEACELGSKCTAELSKRKQSLIACRTKLLDIDASLKHLHNRYTSICAWFSVGTCEGKPRASDEFFGIWHDFLASVKRSLDVADRRSRAPRSPALQAARSTSTEQGKATARARSLVSRSRSTRSVPPDRTSSLTDASRRASTMANVRLSQQRSRTPPRLSRSIVSSESIVAKEAARDESRRRSLTFDGTLGQGHFDEEVATHGKSVDTPCSLIANEKLPSKTRSYIGCADAWLEMLSDS
eukprot:TRINITY_DN11239_c0_g2_i7.p1 TRINITY_DN11239_c0_g2~~TRINITY_DN11239_c0_g2_i7.p1  ORF type:complete len:1513 (+),score=150.37 TRINITY_DN11239_c0_g2_i7:135-4673(+)